jgi:UDP-GlcNAc:undecaprenyl-phosphate/decaprenyl-phosphate GlcNAc-1-phosphate transferase
MDHDSLYFSLLPFALCLALTGVMLALMPAIVQGLRLERRNFAGESVRTGYGLVIWLPAALALGWSAIRNVSSAAPAATALVIFGLVGLADDLWGDRTTGGFRGHFRHLVKHGRLTTGLVKLAVGGGAALALGLWLAGDAAPPLLRALLEPSAPSTASLPPLPDLAPKPPPEWVGLLLVLTSGLVIALSANTLNLFDLRPLRAFKLFGLGAALLLGATIVPLLIPHRLSHVPAWWPMWLRGGLGAPTLWMALLGPALAAALLYAPLEARRRTMLGDTGANALGALLGVAACALLPLAGQAVLAVGLVGLNLYAETHSLSELIRTHHLLNRLDRWGWRKNDDDVMM